MSSSLYKIGLTGGIASGKSRLLEYLSKASSRIYPINLDVTGHNIYRYNPQVLRNVAQIFGKGSIHTDSDGNLTEINRDVLGRLVFEDKRMLLALRQLVSPEIKALLKETLKEVKQRGGYDIVAVEGAVLIEAETYKMFDELWVTTLDKEEAVKRVHTRNPNLDLKQARARVYSQIDDTERLKYASFHYDTSNTWEYNRGVIDRQLASLRDRGLLKD